MNAAWQKMIEIQTLRGRRDSLVIGSLGDSAWSGESNCPGDFGGSGGCDVPTDPSCSHVSIGSVIRSRLQQSTTPKSPTNIPSDRETRMHQISNAVQNPVQQSAEPGSTDSQSKQAATKNTREKQVDAAQCGAVQFGKADGVGFEPTDAFQRQ